MQLRDLLCCSSSKTLPPSRTKIFSKSCLQHWIQIDLEIGSRLGKISKSKFKCKSFWPNWIFPCLPSPFLVWNLWPTDWHDAWPLKLEIQLSTASWAFSGTSYGTGLRRQPTVGRKRRRCPASTWKCFFLTYNSSWNFQPIDSSLGTTAFRHPMNSSIPSSIRNLLPFPPFLHPLPIPHWS